MKVDLHTHTHFSRDGLMSPEEYVRAYDKKGFGAVAVTDHTGVEGALAVRAIAPFKVIVAHEVKTSEGEIIGLFLEKSIPRMMSPEDTVKAIRDQGGLVCVPHPFDRVRRSPLLTEALMRIIDDVDVIEAFNARNTFEADNARAAKLAAEHGKPMSAGTDAHWSGEVGGAYVEMPDFDGRDGFLDALQQGRIVGQTAFFGVHFMSTWAKLRWRLRMGPRLLVPPPEDRP